MNLLRANDSPIDSLYVVFEYLTPDRTFISPLDFFCFLKSNFFARQELLHEVGVCAAAGYRYVVVFHLSLSLPFIFLLPFDDGVFFQFLTEAEQVYSVSGISLSHVGSPSLL